MLVLYGGLGEHHEIAIDGKGSRCGRDEVIDGSDVQIEKGDGYTIVSWDVTENRQVVRVLHNLYIYLVGMYNIPPFPWTLYIISVKFVSCVAQSASDAHQFVMKPTTSGSRPPARAPTTELRISSSKRATCCGQAMSKATMSTWWET